MSFEALLWKCNYYSKSEARTSIVDYPLLTVLSKL